MAQDIQTNVVLTADNSQYDQAMLQSAGSTDSLGKSVDSLGTKIDKLTKSAGRKLIGISAADAAGVAATTLAYGAFEKQMTALNARAAILNTTMAGQKKAIDGYADSVNDLRSNFGMATQEAAELTSTITRLSGLPASGVNQLAKTFATMGQATQESSSALASSVLQLQKTMGTTPGRETERYANQLTVLSQSTAGSATALSDFAQQIAPVARQVGTTQTEVQGLSAAFYKAGADGYQAANFYTRMMNDISYAAQSGSPRLNEFADLAGVLPEKFKGMTGLEQFNSILEGLSKEGPRAINTLNQLGYEGQRMSKIALTLSQQGGIMSMVGQAKAADRDPGAMARGAEKAMDGMFDSMSRLRIAVTQMAEAFGKFWAGPAAKVFDMLAGGAKVLRDLAASPLGQLAAAVAGLAAPFIAFAGAILLAAKAIGAFALARQVMTGAVSSGFKETAALSTSQRAMMAAQGVIPGVGRDRMALGRQGMNITDDPTWARRMMYNTGADVARLTGYQTGQAGSLLRTTGGLGLYGAGRAMQMAVAPQFAAASIRVPGWASTGGYNDVTRRMPIFTSNTMRGSFGMGPEGMLTRAGQSFMTGWRGTSDAVQTGYAGAQAAAAAPGAPTGFFGRMASAYQGARGAMAPIMAPLTTPLADPAAFREQITKGRTAGASPEATKDAIRNMTTAQQAGAKAADEGAKSTARFAKTVAMSEKGMGVFGKAMAQTAVAMGTAGAGMARFGAGIAGQAFSLVGGNWLMAGGIGAYAGYKAYQASEAGVDTPISPRTGFSTPYLEEAGLTSLPGAPLALAAQVKESKGQSLSQAYRISTAEDAAAQASTYQLTNPEMDLMRPEVAEAALGAQWKYGSQSPEFVAQAAADLTSKYGKSTAQEILGRLRGGTQQTPYFLAGEAAQPGYGEGFSGFMNAMQKTQSAEAALPKVNRLFGIIDDTGAMIEKTQGVEEARQYQLEAFNSSIGEFNEGLKETGGNWKVQGTFFKAVLGGLGAEGLDKIDHKAASGIGEPESVDQLLERAIVGRTVAGTEYEPIISGDMLKGMLSAAGVEDTSLTGQSALDALLKAQQEAAEKSEKQVNNAFTQMAKQTQGTFGPGGILALPAVERALVTKSGDPNAFNIGVGSIVQQMRSKGLSPVQQVGELLGGMATAGGVPQLGSELMGAGLAQVQQSMALRAPYQTRTGSFAQQTRLFQTVQEAPLAGPEGRQIQQDNALAYAQQVQGQYEYFKSLLYQQREYNVMRERSEDAFALQRSYAQDDYHLQRQRQEEEYDIARQRAVEDFHRSMRRANFDYNLQRERAEEDHDHQVKLMIESQAQAYTNMYQRVAVQRTTSAEYATANVEDQTRRIRQQTQDLNQIRELGLSNMAIQQGGLNTPEKAQQLARFVAQAQADPTVIRELNRAVRANVRAAGGLATDESQKDWREFQRSYHLQMRRGADDFDRSMRLSRDDFNRQLGHQQDDYQRMMDNQQEDYEKMMHRQVVAYNIQMEQAAEDLERSAKTIDGNFEEILTKATRRLSGHAKEQAKAVKDEFEGLKDDISPRAVRIMTMLSDIFGFDWKPPASAASGNRGEGASPGGTDVGGLGTRGPNTTGGGIQRAEGGMVPGWTPGRDTVKVDLSGGEAIMRPEWARAVGEKSINQMNHNAKYGLREGGLFWPVPGRDTGTYSGHSGVDINRGSGWDDYGDPIVAARSGTVSYVGTEHGFGNAIFIRLPNGLTNIYGHTSRQVVDIGDTVRGGQKIGEVGNTGNSTAPHLHFEVQPGGTYEAAMRFLGGAMMGQQFAGLSFGGGAAAAGPSIPSFAALMDRVAPSMERMEDKVAQWRGVHLPAGTLTRNIRQMAREKYQSMKERYGATVGGGGVPDAPSDVSGNQALVRRAMQQAGWHQWDPLYQLVMHESGFRNTAQNPTSTAYGMFQFLDGTWAGTGIAKTSDPWKQSVAGMRYIRNRYGSPQNAWDFWQNNGSYADGSVFTGRQTIEVGESGPEAVLPLNQRGSDFISDLLDKHSVGREARGVGLGSVPVGAGMTVMNYRIDKSTTFSGPITVQANDPNELIAKLQARNRLQALTRPALGGSRV